MIIITIKITIIIITSFNKIINKSHSDSDNIMDL